MSGPLGQEEWAKLRAASAANLDHVIAEVGLPKVLLGYQARTVALLDSIAIRVLFIEKSRRIGETWALAAWAVLRAGRAKAARGMDVLYISYKLEIAKEFIDACAMWARAFAQGVLEQGEFLFEDTNPKDPSDTKSIQSYRIRFASGFEIKALSSAPRSLRGQQGAVIIDEAAFVDNLAELLKAALAFLMWGGKVIVCSTHNGAENEFNVQVQDILGERSKYAHLRIDFDEALLDGLFQRICLVNGEEWTPDYEARWRQETIDFYRDHADEELFCVPSQGSGAWLTAPLIEARMTLAPDEAPIVRIELPADFLHRPELERKHLLEPHLDAIKRALEKLEENRLHALGYDPARKVDPSIFHLLAIERDLRRRSALTVEMRNVPFAEQRQIGALIIRNAPSLVGVAVDATGMGMNLAEDLGRAFGLRDDDHPGGLVWPIKFNPGWYNENFPPLKTAFEDGAIALAADAEHQSDLRMVKVIRGIPMVPPEREGEAGKKRHGDFAVALALAHFASRQQWRDYGYQPVPLPGREEPDRFRDLPDEAADVELRAWWKPPLGAGLRGGI
jgi:phage FluMu gp28-like protein